MNTKKQFLHPEKSDRSISFKNNSSHHNQSRTPRKKIDGLPTFKPQLERARTIKDLMNREKKKLPRIDDSWNNSRDVSYLKEARGAPIKSSYLNLPTDLNALTVYPPESKKIKNA